MYDGNWSNKNIKNQTLWSLQTGYMNICLPANEYLYSKYIYMTEFVLSLAQWRGCGAEANSHPY